MFCARVCKIIPAPSVAALQERRGGGLRWNNTDKYIRTATLQDNAHLTHTRVFGSLGHFSLLYLSHNQGQISAAKIVVFLFLSVLVGLRVFSFLSSDFLAYSVGFVLLVLSVILSVIIILLVVFMVIVLVILGLVLFFLFHICISQQFTQTQS